MSARKQDPSPETRGAEPLERFELSADHWCVQCRKPWEVRIVNPPGGCLLTHCRTCGQSYGMACSTNNPDGPSASADERGCLDEVVPAGWMASMRAALGVLDDVAYRHVLATAVSLREHLEAAEATLKAVMVEVRHIEDYAARTAFYGPADAFREHIARAAALGSSPDDTEQTS